MFELLKQHTPFPYNRLISETQESTNVGLSRQEVKSPLKFMYSSEAPAP